MNNDIVVDQWPAFNLSPVDYEKVVQRLVRDAGVDVTDWTVKHLESLQGVDGQYIIDVTVRFRLQGFDYVTLFECKQHKDPVKREYVQALRDKLTSIGAHKGVMVAPNGFQSGALEYARIHGIACVRLVDGAWTYELRNILTSIMKPSGEYVGYWNRPMPEGQR